MTDNPMIDRTDTRRLSIKDGELYLECGENDLREVTNLRKWVPGHGPDYFEVWIDADTIVIGHSNETPIFHSTITPDGFLENKLPGDFFYYWIGPDLKITMNQAIAPAVEDRLQELHQERLGGHKDGGC